MAPEASHAGGQVALEEEAAFQDDILPDEEHEGAKAELLQDIRNLLTKYGSAGRYLRACYGDSVAAESFLEELHGLHQGCHGWLNLSKNLPHSTSTDDVTSGGVQWFVPGLLQFPDLLHSAVGA